MAPGAWGNTPERLVQAYAEARIADIGQRDGEALKRYFKLASQAPDSDVIADRMFEVAIRVGDMTAAARAAKSIEARGGGSNLTTLVIFADAWRAKNWRAAADASNRLASSGNLTFMAPILKGWVQVGQGRLPELADSETQNDGFFAYYSADQRIYLDLASGRLSRAKTGLRGLAGQSGDHVHDVMIASAYSFAQSDPDFAQALMRSAVGTIEPLNIASQRKSYSASAGLSAFYARIASALTEQDMAEEGLILARAAQWIAPEQAPAGLALADALAANGLRDKALELLATPVEDRAYGIAVLEKRVDLLIAQDKAEEARAVIIDAARQTPKSVAVKLLSARVFEALGNKTAVISTYREITEAPDFAELAPRQQGTYRMLLAAALDSSEDWEGARAELERLLATDPNNAQALNYLGYSLLERGEANRTRATELVKRAHAIDPSSAAIADSLGWAYYLGGDAAKALPLLEKAAKEAAHDPAISEHLGDAYWSVGRRRDARYAWRVASHGRDGDDAARLQQKIDVGLADNAR